MKSFLWQNWVDSDWTVGKIYAGILIRENWKAYKTSQNHPGYVSTPTIILSAAVTAD